MMPPPMMATSAVPVHFAIVLYLRLSLVP